MVTCCHGNMLMTLHIFTVHVTEHDACTWCVCSACIQCAHVHAYVQYVYMYVFTSYLGIYSTTSICSDSFIISVICTFGHLGAVNDLDR